MDPKARIEYLVDESGITVKAWAALVGVSAQNLYDIIHGKTKNISASICDKIISKYPEISRAWLQAGEGPVRIGQAGAGNINISKASLNHTSVASGISADAFLNELAAQREVTTRCLDRIEKSQSQIDRLLALLERNTN